VSRKPRNSRWSADVKIGGSPKAGEPLYDLDRFTDASMQTWNAYARAVRDFHYALYFDLEGQRAARHKEIRSALQSVEAIAVPIDGWCRVTNFKYSMSALSPAGSLTFVGGRFNYGRDIDEARFAPFPALYIAEDFETAYREYYGLPQGEHVAGLRPEELSLENEGSFAALKLAGQVSNVFDLTTSNLNALIRILSKFTLSSRVQALERNMRKLEKPARAITQVVRTSRQMIQSIMISSWEAWPVHFDVPANSQVFAAMVVEAGFEAILYPSIQSGKRCLAIFTRKLTHSTTRVALHADRPANIEFAEITSENCLQV
jgi:hypothetical protein